MIYYLNLKTMVVSNDLVNWVKRNINKFYEVFKDRKERDNFWFNESGTVHVINAVLSCSGVTIDIS